MAHKRYRLSSTAVADMEEIADYLGEKNSSAADRVIDELYRTFGSLARFPELGTSLDELRLGLRALTPARPAANYVVFYYQTSDGVMISGVIHAARDWIGMFASGERS